MNAEQKAQHAELCQHREALRKSLALCEAAIAELEGKPARAAFERAIAGEAPYSNDLYIALRVEEYRESGRFYEHERPEDLALIREHALVVVDHVAGIPVTVDPQ